MAAFDPHDIVWSRLDVTAIVAHSGVATVVDADRGTAERWFRQNSYEVNR